MNWIRLVLFAAGIVSASPIYTLTDLGTLGGSSAQAFGLNSSGQAVGAATTTPGYLHAFTSSGAGMTDLTINSSAEGFATSVNSAGQIAGAQFSGGQAFATIWANGNAIDVAGAGSYAMGINDGGQVAGMVTTAGGQGHAFVTANGVIQDLGTLPGGLWSAAYAVNNAGQVAGYGDVNGTFRAFAWSSLTGYRVLGTFGGANSYGMAINGTGQLAGSAQLLSGYLNAFVWNGTFLLDLGTLGGSSSYAYGINDQGNAVGYSSVASGDTHAFLYKGGMLYDLNDLLTGAPGWTITEAFAINGSNQIAGTGIFNGVEHAVLLTDPPAAVPDGGAPAFFGGPSSSVPEPSAWILAFTGLAVVLLRRRNARGSGTRAT